MSDDDDTRDGIQDWDWFTDKETPGSDFAIRAYGLRGDPAIDAEDQRPEGSPSSFPLGETTQHDLLDEEVEDRTASRSFICLFCSTCPKEFATKLELRSVDPVNVYIARCNRVYSG